jgi:hypothetical protein
MDAMRCVQLASLVLLACGGGPSHHLADGAPDSPIDLHMDAPTPDAPATGSVSVVVTVQGSAGSNVPVYFQNADSTLVLEAITDATGRASATMKSGGFVSVLEPPTGVAVSATIASNQVIKTFAGVKIGDELQDDIPGITSITTTTVAASISGDPNPAAFNYQIHTTCNGDSSPQFLSKGSATGSGFLGPVTASLPNCGGTADIVVVSFSSTNVPLDFFALSNVAITQGSNLALSGTYTPVIDQQLAFIDLPAEVNQIDLDSAVSDARGTFYAESTFAFSNGSGVGSAAAPMPLIGSASIAAFEYTLIPQGDIADTQHIIDWGAPPQGPLTIDIGARKLRSWVTQPTLDPTNQQLSWSVATAGATPDYVVTEVQASRTGSAGTTTWSWFVAAPGDEDGAIAFPTLPTDIFDFAFRDTDNISTDGTAGVISAGGYDAARPLVFDQLTQITSSPLSFATTAHSGSIETQLTQTSIVAAPKLHARK